MSGLSYLLRVSMDKIKANEHRFPGLKPYEIECILILESIKEEDQSHPYIKRYRAYVRTRHWMIIKNKRLKLSNDKCDICGSNNDLQVHHIRYKNLYDVDLDDLQAICKNCHYKHHEN